MGISLGLNVIRKEAKITDLSFICQTSDHSIKVIPAHQIIFTTLSTKLKCLIEMVNQIQPHENVIVILDSVKSSILEKLIEYIYIGETHATVHEKREMIELCQFLN